jgi:chromosome segregation ATPase
MKHKPAILTAFSLALAAVCFPSLAVKFNADEQDVAALSGNALKATGTKIYGRGVLKADDVKDCVATAAKLNALNKEVRHQKQSAHASAASANDEAATINKLDAEVRAEQAALDARVKELREEKAKLDTGNKDAVTAFNSKSAAFEQDKDAYKAKVKDFNERVTKPKATGGPDVAAFNAKLNDLNAQLDDFDSRCGGKDYYADDFAAAKAALKK